MLTICKEDDLMLTITYSVSTLEGRMPHTEGPGAYDWLITHLEVVDGSALGTMQC